MSDFNFGDLMESIQKAKQKPLPSPSSVPSTIQSLFGLPSEAVLKFTGQPVLQIRTNLYYRNKKIYIDGYTFQNCRFDQCNLVTNRGAFRFVNCIFDSTTTVEYNSFSLNIIKLYNATKGNSSHSASPTINLDGTITI